MKGKFLIFICLILFVISMACVSAADDANQTLGEDAGDMISVSLEDNEIIGDDVGCLSELQLIIDKASEGSTVNLNKNYDCSDYYAQIDKRITINGNGHTIDGGFDIRSSGVVLSNINFSMFSSTSIFAVQCEGDNGAILNCNFINCGSGAVSLTGNNYIIRNSNFMNNNGFDGGAVLCDGDLTVSGCSFTDNGADEGGAIKCIGELTLDGCDFKNNHAGDGDSIFVEGNLTAGNCSFVNEYNIEFSKATIYVKGKSTIDGCSFVNNTNYYGNGGAICVDGELTVDGCSFTDNGECDYGGAIYVKGILDVRRSSFSNNNVIGGGGAICVDGELTVDGCTFANNSASYGGAIYSKNTNVKISNTKFINNTPNDFNPAKIHVENITRSSSIVINGDVFFVSDAVVINISVNKGATGDVIVNIAGDEEKLTLTDSTASFVKSDLAAGSYDVQVRYLGDDSFSPNEKTSTVKVVEASFKDLQDIIDKSHDGDVIELDKNYTYVGYRDNSAVQIRKSIRIEGNGYVLDGNGENLIFDIEDCNVTLNNISFERGSITNVFADGIGGAIYSKNSILTVGNCRFEHNHAVESGAIYCENGILNIYDSSFVKNSYYAIYSGANLTVSNTDFTENDYAAIYCKGTSSLSGCGFSDNEGLDGIVFNEGIMTLEDCSFTHNTGSDSVIYNKGKMILENCSFTHNQAFLGIVYSLTDLTAKDCSFTDGLSYQAAISAQGNVQISNSNFTNNRANDLAGAVYCSGNVTISDCSFVNNRAALYGGAICGGGNLTVRNCEFVGNAGYESGGAVYAWGNSTFIACRFEDNEGSHGSAIYLSRVSNKVIDSVFVGYGTVNKTYHDVSKSILNDKNFICAESDYELSNCDLIESTKYGKYFIQANNLSKYYGSPDRFYVSVLIESPDGGVLPAEGVDVTIHLNGVTYIRTTNEIGEASMAINLNSGLYDVTSEIEGNKVQSKILVKPTVSGNNVTKIFRNATQYYATFLDTMGNLMGDTNVEFNINGVFYTRTTNEEGVARMNINLNPGVYVITAKNPETGEQHTNVITVLPSIVENHDLTKYYRNASQYSLRLLDDKGNPVKAGVEITLNINGVFYKRISNDDGYVKMNINLEPGEYIITADYNGLMASNTIKVLSVIETHDLSMKYKDGSKFEARILDGQGNPYAGQTVTFNINGVFYERITDEEGIARLAINLMAGEYIITSSYNGLNAANTVTVSS
ncbi:right-handed parallel beta-helix repeat-containing protein [Methanobrevibacter millerae]|uniref:Polymorphic outer membrane protein repeat-containing protein n=1 Tax=Methanobrevibacter millerae TaxID=230361 RepID=A0A1G5X614_9EURY|nr:right-handed parallel beta-helix repeat-containing protein [Methanobrevibacter millerae]SDA65217.1 polymorphic outer membrane protein repeat-containing protein [Methanobrevibacter millerae]